MKPTSKFDNVFRSAQTIDGAATLIPFSVLYFCGISTITLFIRYVVCFIYSW